MRTSQPCRPLIPIPCAHAPSQGLSLDESHARDKQRRQLDRLETLVDSVYALVLVLSVGGLPAASEYDVSFESPWDFLALHGDEIGGLIPGIALLILYWIQHNALFG